MRGISRRRGTTTGRTPWLLGVAVLILPAPVFAASCSSAPATIDGALLSSNIQQDAASTDLKLAKVDCPLGRAPTIADHFSCTATMVAGGTLVYDVEITSEQGAYTYRLAPNQVLNGDDLAKELTLDISTSAAALADAVVTCPRTIVSPGGKAAFECTVVTGGQKAVLAVTKESAKKADWQFKK